MNHSCWSKGIFRLPPCTPLDITDCDIKFLNSCWSSWNIKSSGKRSLWRVSFLRSLRSFEVTKFSPSIRLARRDSPYLICSWLVFSVYEPFLSSLFASQIIFPLYSKAVCSVVRFSLFVWFVFFVVQIFQWLEPLRSVLLSVIFLFFWQAFYFRYSITDSCPALKA